MAAASQPRQLTRLHIPPAVGPQQQPFIYGDNAPMYSPSLPTAINVGAHNGFPIPHHHLPLHTPMQAQFFPRQPPGPPGRPGMHRAHPSMVLPPGMMPPPGIPMTPLGQMGFQNHMPPPFVPRSKRTQSVSTGGPPKAVLGGPQRKISPMPPSIAPAAPAPKQKRIVVNLPKEGVKEGDQDSTRPTWKRTPIPTSELPVYPDVPGPELTTVEAFPSDAWRRHIPPTVDVFLPGKSAWKAIKQRVIEEKLEKLGVEKGSGSNMPNIHAPHARAASISSPADPALLLFKLNKLQQSQNASAIGSLASSPQPHATPSPPNGLPPRFQNRHGHSMSLAPAPANYNPAGPFNPFGMPVANATSDATPLHAPQGRMPTDVASLAPPTVLSRPESRPDFMRGFGLDATEEEEEPPEEPVLDSEIATEATDASGGEQVDIVVTEDGMSTVAQSRVHSRHVSKLSAALSLRAVGGRVEVTDTQSVAETVPEGEPPAFDADDDPVAEWTGSEDMKTGVETSDDESIGEWSNPSDEERARQDRLHRRMVRRAKEIHRDLEAPRRLPNFPRPPESFVPITPAEDDVISNPSDEERRPYMPYDRVSHFPRPASSHSSQGRPLPPVPHSRTTSAHLSYHDPALAHSREGSESFRNGTFGSLAAITSSASRTESLNPHAKPFVFGPKPSLPPASPPVTLHARTASFGKPLNVAAPEFKPGGFTFQPPPGVPQLSFPVPAAAPPRPLPSPPLEVTAPVRATQGREKRIKRESDVSMSGDEDEDDDREANDTMSSFKFPPPADDTRKMRHSAPTSPPTHTLSLNAAAKPFTFSGMTGLTSAHSLSQNTADTVGSLIAQASAMEDASGTDTVKAAPAEPTAAAELPYPPMPKPKRAPIPLDFKHPVSGNTVPAGLFKSLINGDSEERTRRSVRSRLSSRDVFEHSPRPSLDDLSVPPISSQRRARNRNFTEPGPWDYVDEDGDEDELFSPNRVFRRASMPPRHASPSGSELSIGPMNLSRRLEMQQYEQKLETLLDEKISGVQKALEDFKVSSTGQGQPQALSSSVESVITEAIAKLRAQMQDFAARSPQEGERDARGDFDFEMLRDIIVQTQAESRNVIQRDLEDLFTSRNPANDFRKFAEELSERTMKAVITATSQVTMHMHTLEKSRSPLAVEREALVHEILSRLAPHLAAIRPEPIDYDSLTTQLSQAVKPHISQLIDLASDKRETAGLIVDRLVPILPSIYPPTPELDTEGIIGRLTTEIRRAVGPMDAHEIKEQVSDLVVERLDSRLAVRDRQFSVDSITEKLTDNVRGLLEPFVALKSTVEELGRRPNVSPSPPSVDLSGLRGEIAAALADLPSRLDSAIESINATRVELERQGDRQTSGDTEEDIRQILDNIEEVADEQKQMVAQNNEFSEFCQGILKHINELPEAIVEATKILQDAHANILARDTSKKDAEEIHRLISTNSELQVQVAKARGAHGQVRVEKDILADRLHAVEAERDSIRARLDEAQSTFSEKIANVASMETRTAELETSLAQALDRAKVYDATIERNQARIAELEKAVSELTNEKVQLKTQVTKLEADQTVAVRENNLLSDEVSSLRKRNDDLSSQQSQWEDLRRATDQIQTLAALFGQADLEEIKELRQTRDKFKVLEGEHAALQRRYKDQDGKIVNAEKTAFTARQTLDSARQRASEWEKRAKEYEQELDRSRSKANDAEQARSQMEADYSMVKVQLEERDAEERLTRDRESKLRDQIAALEAQMARVQADADRVKKATSKAPNGLSPKPNIPSRSRSNGYTHISHTPTRPDSRASTVYGDSRVVTPTAHMNGGSYTPSIRASSPAQPSVWDSIHAPNARREDPIRLPMTPKGVRSHSYYRPQIPSPTPSNVSAAPTLGEDGWWS